MSILTGKTAVVTGSTSGIGFAYARAFAGAGASIVLNGMGAPTDVEKERSAIENDFRVKAIYSPANVAEPMEIASMISLAEKTFGRVDVLVNNAGIQYVSPIEDFPVEKWDAVIAINLSSAFHAIRAVTPGMKQRGWRRIINTASAHSLVASPFESAYVAAKHGIAGLTKTVALELARSEITCNCISPGYVWTPLVGEADSGNDEATRHERGSGDQGRPARDPADEGIRYGRAGCFAGAVPVRPRRRADHRRQPLCRRRLDGRVGAAEMHTGS